MAKSLNPTDISNKWVNAMQGATQSYTNGVNSVTTAPGQLAAAAQNKYLSGVQAAVANNSYATNSAAVSLQSWQQSAISKGSARIGPGASASKSKYSNFLNKFIPALQSAQQQVQSMPSDTYQQRQARANAMMDALHGLKGKLKGS